MEKRNYDEIPKAQETAIWIRESKTGTKYLSGIIKIDGKEIQFVAFKNEKKEGKQPDFRFAEKKEEKKEEIKIEEI